MVLSRGELCYGFVDRKIRNRFGKTCSKSQAKAA